jgi:hypothetical protein
VVLGKAEYEARNSKILGIVPLAYARSIDPVQ